MEPPKIAWLLRDFEQGGMQRVAVSLMPHLGRADSLVISLAGGPLAAALTHRHLALGLPTHPRRPLRLWHYLTLIRRLARMLDAERPQALMAFGYSMIVLATLARPFCRHRFRLIANLRNALTEPQQRPRLDPVRTPLRFALRRADLVVPVTHALGRECAALGVSPGRIHVIPNGVQPTVYAAAQADLKHPWLADLAPILVTVGRLSQQKNHPLLLHALAQVRQQLPARLWLIGAGPLREELAATAAALSLETAVDFLGYQPNPHRYVARAQLFVLSSNFEGYPNALIEAMALGTAVVATDCPTGPAEIIEHGRSGLLVPVGDAAALADAILHLLCYPAERAALAQQAASSVPRFADTVAAYQKLLAATAATNA